MRWIATRHESHFVEAKRLQHLKSSSKVAVMNRIKSTAEYSDRPHQPGAFNTPPSLPIGLIGLVISIWFS
jgi:hypothetical protein